MSLTIYSAKPIWRSVDIDRLMAKMVDEIEELNKTLGMGLRTYSSPIGMAQHIKRTRALVNLHLGGAIDGHTGIHATNADL